MADERSEEPIELEEEPLSSSRRDVVFALSMVAFAMVGTFCVVSAFSVLLR